VVGRAVGGGKSGDRTQEGLSISDFVCGEEEAPDRPAAKRELNKPPH
jgi:hypothetical protein